MSDEANEPRLNGEVTLDWPGTLTAAEDWENVWPKSHKVWRVATTFDVVGHPEGRARERFEYVEEAQWLVNDQLFDRGSPICGASPLSGHLWSRSRFSG